jgi:hypothetical protein
MVSDSVTDFAQTLCNSRLLDQPQLGELDEYLRSRG